MKRDPLVDTLLALETPQRLKALRLLSDEEKREIRHHWPAWARDAQLPPAQADWRLWLILAGRGFGKTRAGAEWIRRVAETTPEARIALVAASLGEGRAVMVEGESGLLAVASPGRVPLFEPSLKRLTWPNGAQATLYSAGEPESLRGPQHSHAWCDEIAKWETVNYRAVRAWDNLQMGLRLGECPQALATTTPRSVPLLRRLLADPDLHLARGRSEDNADNLPARFLRDVRRQYGKSALGRQELDGELIEDIEGALWTRACLEACREPAASSAPVRTVIGVDPPASSGGDACGIVVCALGEDGVARVLADCSVEKASPEKWARAVAKAAEAWCADRVVAEANQGGAMVASVLRAADLALPMKLVHASQGKTARAEPVAALYEAGRVRHCGQFPTDCDACDVRLTLRPDRNQAAQIALPDPATSTENEDFGGKAGYARKRAPEPDQPVAVLRYYDVDRDFQPGAQRASGRPASGQPRTIELPAALAAGDARRLIDQAAKRTQWARQTVSWRVTQLDPAVRPGTTVRLPGHAGLWRVREWEWRAHGVDLTLVRLSPSVETAAVADSGRSLPATDRPPAPTVLAACEVPWDGNPGTSVPLILAAASSPSADWSGASLFADHGDGVLVPLGQSGRARSVIGTANGALPAASPLFFDRTSSVTVTLCADDLTLASATLRQLAMGANRAVLGDELIQFATAEAVSGGVWKLSGLLRGRGGTEAAVTGHSIGEPFILLDGAATAIDPEAVGTLAQSTLAALGLGDAQPVLAAVRLPGIGQRPLAPVHGRSTSTPGGGRAISWVRRARGAWQWNDNVDVPLGEQNEAYEVTFGTAATTIARWETAVPSLALEPTEVAGLLAMTPSGQFSVRQRGDRAVSLPLHIPLT